MTTCRTCPDCTSEGNNRWHANTICTCVCHVDARRAAIVAGTFHNPLRLTHPLRVCATFRVDRCADCGTDAHVHELCADCGRPRPAHTPDWCTNCGELLTDLPASRESLCGAVHHERWTR